MWITGSKGLLGSILCEKCRKEGRSFLETGREVDIGDPDQVVSYVKRHAGISHIINCAAFSDVDAAEKRQEEAYRTNVKGPENLAAIANEMGIKLLHISTDYVFSGGIKRPLTEQDPPSPCNYYGKTKLEGEKIALKNGACVIRTSWLFGLSGKNFASKLLKMLQTQREVRLTDNQWNRFTYSKDLADAILKMLDQTGLYQFANAGVTSKYEFGLKMKELMRSLGCPVLNESLIPVSSAEFPAVCERPVYSALDTAKIESLLKIRGWEEALREFLCEEMPVCLCREEPVLSAPHSSDIY